MTDCFFFLQDGVKAVLPADYTMMTANRMKLFAHYDKMRILEWLTLNGRQNVTEIVNGTGLEQLKVSQFLKSCAMMALLPPTSLAALFLQHYRRRT